VAQRSERKAQWQISPDNRIKAATIKKVVGVKVVVAREKPHKAAKVGEAAKVDKADEVTQRSGWP
jgi:hypothetical protein